MSTNEGRSGGHGFVTCARCGVQFPETGQSAAGRVPLGHGCAAVTVQHEAGTMLVAMEGSDYALSLYRFVDEDGAPARLQRMIAPLCDPCIRALVLADVIVLISHE